MNSPANLFMSISKLDKGLPEEIPAVLVGGNLDMFTQTSTSTYTNLVKTVKKITAKKGESAQREVYKFLQGYILARPYGRENLLPEVNKSLENDFSSLEKTVNNWLQNKFKATHPSFYTKLNNLEYQQEHGEFYNFISNDPEQIKTYVDQTNACIKDNPLNFFNQVVEDPATIYLLGINKKQQKTFTEGTEKGKLDLGYVRLYAFQGKNTKQTALLVDNVWINNNNKQLVCSMLQSVAELANYLETDVVDKAISINFLNQSGNTVDVYDQQEHLFKLGSTSEIRRYTQPHIPTENEGFYLLNKK